MTELAIDQKLRLHAEAPVIAEFTIDLPALPITKRKQQFTGPPQSRGRPVSSEVGIVGH